MSHVSRREINRGRRLITHMLFSYALLAALFLAIIVPVGYTMFFNALKRSLHAANQTLAQSINGQVEAFFDVYDDISFGIYRTESHANLTELLRLAESGNRSGWAYQHRKSILFSSIDTPQSPRTRSEGLLGMYFLNGAGQCYLQNGPDEGLAHLPSGEEDVGKTVVARLGKPLVTASESGDAHAVLFARKIIDTHGASDLGTVWFLVDAGALSAEVDKMTQGRGRLLVMDSFGRCVLRPPHVTDAFIQSVQTRMDAAGSTRVVEGVTYLYNGYESAKYGLRVMVLSPLSSVYQEANRAAFVTAVCIMLMLLLAVLFSVLFTREIRAGFRQLMDFAAEIREGRLDTSLGEQKYREFADLAEAFNDMARSLAKSQQENELLNEKKRDAQLAMLQAQINPHFLHNALNAIGSCAQINGVPVVLEMTRALSDILRYSLKSVFTLVTVRDELDYLGNYIVIQNMRYEPKIKLVYDVDNALLECKTIRFILQPLVENAIMHGLAAQSERIVSIVIKSERGGLCVIVSDNGTGIPRERLDELRRALSSAGELRIYTEDEGRNIGLMNVQRRIKMQFGAQYGLAIDCTQGAGTRCTVVMPRL